MRRRARRTALQRGQLCQPEHHAPHAKALLAFILAHLVPLDPAHPPVLDDRLRNLGPPAQVHPRPVEERRRRAERNDARGDERREVIPDEEDEADNVDEDADEPADRGERVEPGG